jgi:magnesium chelatase subunit I
MTVPRPSDVYTALPSLTGKVELEYEGEMRGADTVVRDIIRQACARVFKKYFDNVPLHPTVQWFELGGTLKYSPHAPAEELYTHFKKIQGLLEQTQHLGIRAKDGLPVLASGAEFILEGLAALKRISRNEELGYHVERQHPETETGESSPIAQHRRRSLN